MDLLWLSHVNAFCFTSEWKGWFISVKTKKMAILILLPDGTILKPQVIPRTEKAFLSEHIRKNHLKIIEIIAFSWIVHNDMLGYLFHIRMEWLIVVVYTFSVFLYHMTIKTDSLRVTSIVVIILTKPWVCLKWLQIRIYAPHINENTV